MQQENEEEKEGTRDRRDGRLRPWTRRRHYRNQMNQMRKMNEGNKYSRGGAKKIRVLVLLLGEDLPHHQ